jgi:hypothetical protein
MQVKFTKTTSSSPDRLTLLNEQATRRATNTESNEAEKIQN